MAECLEAGDTNDGAKVAALFTADRVWEAIGALAARLGTHTGTDAITRRYSLSPSATWFPAAETY